MISPITQRKRQQLMRFIECKLKPQAAVRGVIGIGSIATGDMRAGSDIDAILLMDPLDLYVAPAEAIWMAADDSFHSIFSQEPGVQEEGIQLDLVRAHLPQWADPSFALEEGRKAELAEGWVAFDRDGSVARLLAERTAYADELRLQRLDEAIVTLDGHLKWDEPTELWQSLGAARAHDRLNAAYFYLVQALFAYNRRWRGWRNREMSYLLKLPWLPDNFEERVLAAQLAPSLDLAGYRARFERLSTLLDEVLTRLSAEGDYGSDPINEAFVRMHDEPGRAWNMAAWVERHSALHKKTSG